MVGWTLACRLLLLAAVTMTTELPNLSMSLRRPMVVTAGGDALLTCVVHHLGNYTLLWKRAAADGDVAVVLTAGDYRVASDPRLLLLHDNARRPKADLFDGANVFVLAIQNTTVNDTGMYVCEVNSLPVRRSYHQLTVLSEDEAEAEAEAEDEEEEEAESGEDTASVRSHDYTNCCRQQNVSEACLGLCSLAGLMHGSPANGADCDADFPHIVSCMADGRNHLPCCERQGVPAMCSTICWGHYQTQTDHIREHFSCAAFSRTMINCVARGRDLLPAAPVNVQVEVDSLTDLMVSWVSRRGHLPDPDLFTVNVTRLRSFDGANLGATEAQTESPAEGPTQAPWPSATRLYNVTASRKFLAVDGLQPLTMYEVSVTSHNAAGSSLRSERVRAVTWLLETRNTAVSPPPGLPDVRRCCQDAGVTEARCLRQLCDPRVAADTVVTDVIICAPWAEKTFACMADGRDHSACCRARGLPQICVDLCAGNVTKIDFRYFRCLSFMGSYSSCLMQGYGVLPSAPVDPRLAFTDSNFVVLRWNPPTDLPDTVLSYVLSVRPSRTANSTYVTHQDAHSPFLLDDLLADTEYEFYLEAVNQRGAGPQSSRVIFQTLPEAVLQQEAVQSGYNLSTCCRLAEMSPACMRLCHYDARMSTLQGLAHICTPEYHKLLRCAAGGRDHSTCCQRRGVPSNCLPACRGAGTLSDSCAPFVGNLWQCYEEGSGLLPPPVTALHASGLTNNSVTLIWEPVDGNVTGFQVRYGEVDPASRENPGMDRLDQVFNVTSSGALLEGLRQGRLYSFTAVSFNDYGTSLPTSIITLNVTELDDVMQQAVTSHPHNLTVSEMSATQLTVTWAPPLISHPTDRITYRISWRGPNSTVYNNVTTAALSHRLLDLTPNTQYSVFVTARSGAGDSRPSETLQMWTRPAYPAYVEMPTIHPSDMVKEGGSMTVLCIAMAAPEPTVALYLNGRHVREERTRHLVTSIRNVTRDMTQVTCYADNGYGTPMQATRYVVISRRPVLTSEHSQVAVEGGSATLRCEVDSSPEPQMVFFRDPVRRQLVIDGGNYAISQRAGRQEGRYTMELRIHKVTADDFGQFFCHAENVFGSMTNTLTLRRKEPTPRLFDLGVSDCCRRLNVSSTCRRACAFDVDIAAVLSEARCAGELGKLMRCAADGSDHRQCCAGRKVPNHCLDWCRGQPVLDGQQCALGYVTDVVACFEEGKAVLPGPPLNVRVESVGDNDVIVRWNAPPKNADKVELYRVYWRASGDKVSSRNETSATWLRLPRLRAGVEYECAVKAGNHYGSSQLTAPLLFVPGRIFVSSQSAGNYYIGTGTVLAVVALLVLLLVALLVGVLVYRRRRRKAAAADRVSFENPSYLKEMNLQTLQTSESSFSAGSNGSVDMAANGDTSSSAELRQGAARSTADGPAAPSTRLGALRSGIGLVAKKAGFKQFENEQ